jgi:hypothetical protein
MQAIPELPSWQHRLVTLLYMDVVGSTAMTQHRSQVQGLQGSENLSEQQQGDRI